MMQAQQQPAVISPSLSRLYREELISHVVGWPAEAVEKTCQRVNEDHQNISNLAITRVSAELKMARSLVRLADIQATLQEQRIMFLRQQTADLEAYKARSLSHRDSDSEQQYPPSVRQQAASHPGGGGVNHHHPAPSTATPSNGSAAVVLGGGPPLTNSSSSNSVSSVVR